MNKINTIKVSALSALVLLAACSKNPKIDPPTDKNSNLTLDKIVTTNLISTGNMRLTGYTKLEYIAEKADGSLPMDTIRISDSFNISSNNYTQNYYLNTPDRSKVLNLEFKIVITGGGADAINIGKLSYLWNGQTYFNTPVTMNMIDNKNFITKQVINF
ncbi:hypothetical protein [Taibaiella helva]|uniref:hypothetical protein n=1 Tax=Taibaiella helva TaxID=2301235 RepID=UPI000E5967FB|nr:hypothetical protein [Taibaiella helva]